MNEALKTRIEQRLEQVGKSARGASLEVSTNPDLIRNILTGKSDQPRIDTLEKIAQALMTTPEWLTAKTDVADAHPKSNVRRADIRLAPASQMPNDVPVRGTAAASHLKGAFQLDDNAIDWARRPPAMAGAKDLYALFIEGTSMEPEHRPGDLRFVHPGKPPRIGDSVIVQMKYSEAGGVEAMIGHLLRRSGSKIYVGKLNPEATVELNQSHVIAVHKVLTLNELFGL